MVIALARGTCAIFQPSAKFHPPRAWAGSPTAGISGIGSRERGVGVANGNTGHRPNPTTVR